MQNKCFEDDEEINKKNNKGHTIKKKKNLKTNHVQKLFMGFGKQQLASKVENNILRLLEGETSKLT